MHSWLPIAGQYGPEYFCRAVMYWLSCGCCWLPVGFAYWISPVGIRVELVDGSRREQFKAWFAGGDLRMARSPNEPTP